MKKFFSILALGAFLIMPCVLHAEEVEIQLLEVNTYGMIFVQNIL